MTRVVPAVFLMFVTAMLVFAFWHRTGDPLPSTQVRLSSTMVMSVTAAGNHFIAVGERGRIFKSTQAKWQLMPTPNEATLTRVSFWDEKLGLAVGHDAVILRTTDGGATWKQVHADPEAETPLMDIVWVDASKALVIGAYGLFMESTDAGATWTARAIEEQADAHYNAITKLADGSLLLVGEFGTLLRSNDQGATWTKLSSPYEGSFFGVTALNDQQVLVYGMRGHVVRSDDGGQTFSLVESPTKASLFGAYVDPQGVYLVGQNGELIFSRDGAQSFNVLKVDGNPMLTAVAPVVAGSLYAFGEQGFHTVVVP